MAYAVLASAIAGCSDGIVCPPDDAPLTDAAFMEIAVRRELERNSTLAPSVEAFLANHPECCGVERNVRRFDDWDEEGAHRWEARRLHARPTAVVTVRYQSAELPGQRELSIYWLGACGEILREM